MKKLLVLIITLAFLSAFPIVVLADEPKIDLVDMSPKELVELISEAKTALRKDYGEYTAWRVYDEFIGSKDIFPDAAKYDTTNHRSACVVVQSR